MLSSLLSMSQPSRKHKVTPSNTQLLNSYLLTLPEIQDLPAVLASFALNALLISCLSTSWVHRKKQWSPSNICLSLCVSHLTFHIPSNTFHIIGIISHFRLASFCLRIFFIRVIISIYTHGSASRSFSLRFIGWHWTISWQILFTDKRAKQLNININFNKRRTHGVKLKKKARTYRKWKTVHQEIVQLDSSSQTSNDYLWSHHMCNPTTNKMTKTLSTISGSWSRHKWYEQERQLKKENQRLTQFMRSKEGSRGLVSRIDSCLDKNLVSNSCRANSEALLFIPMSLPVWPSIFLSFFLCEHTSRR